jgi:orotate phosphoribosyltransferase
MITRENEIKTTDQIAESLLKIGAVQLSPEKPYKWASGWLSPIYCDNRVTLSFPTIRTIIKEKLVNRIKDKFPQVQVVAGVATAGVPQGAMIADALQLSFVYVRPKPKDHGMKNQIEGKIEPGKNVVVVEDLISTGSSSLKAVSALREAGFHVLGMVAIFTYAFEIADKNFANASVHLEVLCSYPDLIQKAIEMGMIEKKHLDTLNAWRNNPDNWKA